MERWRVLFWTPLALADELVGELRKILPGEQVGVVDFTEDDDRPLTAVSVTVAATVNDEAYELAADAVAQAAEQGGLELPVISDEATATVLHPSVVADSLDEELTLEAQYLWEAGHHESTVLRAQAACEVYARKVLEDLAVKRGGDKLFKAIKPRAFSLIDDGTIALFYLLTGEWIDQREWWKGYRQHVNRRHRIIHAGGVVGKDEAHRSLKAMAAFHSYLKEAWGRALGTDVDSGSES
jgi:hypothetical protein